MHPDQIQLVWKRRRGLRKIHLVAVLIAVAAPLVLAGLFKQIEHAKASARPERQVFASIDLRIGNPVFSAQQGEEQARKDIEAGTPQWQTLAAEPTATPATKAKAALLKERYGLTRRYHGEVHDPVVLAYVEAYNRVVQAEIERKFGPEVLKRLQRDEDPHPAKPDQAASP